MNSRTDQLNMSRYTPSPNRVPILTSRELEVLHQMAEGHTKRRIAELLFLSLHTVDTHVRHIYEKLQVHSGRAAITKAIRARII